MTEWLNASFEDNSIAWLLIASILGSVITLSLKFLFEDVIKFHINQKRQLNKIVSHYSSPLLRTGLSLERRVNNFIRSIDQDWYGQGDDYYRMSTLYVFGEFLAWVRIIERKKNYLEFTKSKRSREFDQRLYGAFKALTSFAYFKEREDLKEVGMSAIPRMILTGIGEAMTFEKGEDYAVLEFTEFVNKYYEEPDRFRWFEPLDTFLKSAKDNALVWDRLIILQAHLKHFVLFLDKDQSHVRNKNYANLDLMKDKEAQKGLLAEIR